MGFARRLPAEEQGERRRCIARHLDVDFCLVAYYSENGTEPLLHMDYLMRRPGGSTYRTLTSSHDFIAGDLDKTCTTVSAADRRRKENERKRS